MVDSPPARPVDDETAAALTLFNEYLNADREREQRARRLKKAERAKDEAAAAVRKLEGTDAAAETKAEAEGEYRKAADTWMRLRDGKEPGPAAEEPAAETAPEPAAEEPAPEAEPEAETAPEPAIVHQRIEIIQYFL